MEPGTWTDERIDAMVAAHDNQFELLRQDIRDLRAEMHDLRKDVRTDMKAMENGLRAEIDEVRGMVLRCMIGVMGILGAQSVALVALAT